MSLQINVDTNSVCVPHFRPLLYNQSRHLLLKGGAGSGKSHFVAQKYILRLLDGISCNKIHRFLVLRKTQPSARNSVYRLIKNYLVKWKLLNNVCEENKTNLEFNFAKGAQIICGGLDNPEKINSIEGITGIWVEEATQFTKEDLLSLNLRIRGETPSYKQICYSFNPIRKNSYIYKRFYSNGNIPDATYDASTYTDNPFIDVEYRTQLEDLINQDQIYYNVYCKGEWGVLGGQIYTAYEVIPIKQYPQNFDDVVYGLDFGFNHPSALIEIGFRDDELYFKEKIYQKGLTNPSLINEMKHVIPEKNQGCLIYADSAEPARIQDICDAGFNCIGANKSVKDGIDFLKSKKKHIASTSTNLLDEIETYKYKQDKDGEYLDEPVKFKDDALDATRYGAYSYGIEGVPGIFTT